MHSTGHVGEAAWPLAQSHRACRWEGPGRRPRGDAPSPLGRKSCPGRMETPPRDPAYIICTKGLLVCAAVITRCSCVQREQPAPWAGAHLTQAWAAGPRPPGRCPHANPGTSPRSSRRAAAAAAKEKFKYGRWHCWHRPKVEAGTPRAERSPSKCAPITKKWLCFWFQ